MRVGVDVGRVHRRVGVGQVGLQHAAGLGGEAEHGAVGVESPLPLGHLSQPGQIVHQHDPLAEAPVAGPVGEGGRDGAVHRNGHHRHIAVGHHPRQPHPRGQIIERQRHEADAPLKDLLVMVSRSRPPKRRFDPR